MSVKVAGSRNGDRRAPVATVLRRILRRACWMILSAERPGAEQPAPGRQFVLGALGNEPADEPGQRAKQLVQQANEADHIVERLQDRANQIAQGSG